MPSRLARATARSSGFCTRRWGEFGSSVEDCVHLGEIGEHVGIAIGSLAHFRPRPIGMGLSGRTFIGLARLILRTSRETSPPANRLPLQPGYPMPGRSQPEGASRVRPRGSTSPGCD